MDGWRFKDEAPARIRQSQLRRFAALSLLVFGLLFAVNIYRHEGAPTALGWVCLALAAAVGIPGLIRPSSVRPVFLGATVVTRPIGHFISLLLLGAVYYGFLTPLAYVFRSVRRDVLRRRHHDATSYWTSYPQPADPRRYLRQYQRQ